MFMLMTKEQNRHMSASPGSNEDNNPDPNYEFRPVSIQDLFKKVDKYDKNGNFSLTCYLTSTLARCSIVPTEDIWSRHGRTNDMYLQTSIRKR